MNLKKIKDSIDTPEELAADKKFKAAVKKYSEGKSSDESLLFEPWSDCDSSFLAEAFYIVSGRKTQEVKKVMDSVTSFNRKAISAVLDQLESAVTRDGVDTVTVQSQLEVEGDGLGFTTEDKDFFRSNVKAIIEEADSEVRRIRTSKLEMSVSFIRG